MSDGSLRELHDAIVDLHGELHEEGSEFDFRYPLVDHLFTDALGWTRTEGECHVNFEHERARDFVCELDEADIDVIDEFLDVW